MSADEAEIVAARPPEQQLAVQLEGESFPRRVLIWADGAAECDMCWSEECKHMAAARAWVAANLPPAEALELAPLAAEGQ